MKKFLVLYNAPVEVMEKWSNMSEEDQKKAMDGWKKWGEGHKDDFADFGAPVGKNKRVTKDGATNVRNEVGGYSVMHAESHEDAVKIVSDSPHFDPEGTYIEVMELMDM